MIIDLYQKGHGLQKQENETNNNIVKLATCVYKPSSTVTLMSKKKMETIKLLRRGNSKSHNTQLRKLMDE